MVDATIPQERCDFYVYVIFRPDGTPCYVGKGVGIRWTLHAKRCGAGSERVTKKGKLVNYRNKALKAIYIAAGGDLPIVKVRDGITEKEAFETEMRLIVAIGRADLDGGPLVNLTDGGDGASGHILSKETKQKIGLSKFGKKMFPETLAKLIAANLGKKQSPEHIAKKIAALIGKKRSPEAIEKTRLKIIGRTQSLETRAKIRAKKLGKKRNSAPEALAKMGAKISATKQQNRADKIRAAAGPWLIDPGPEFRARAASYHENARRMASQPAEQLALDL